MIFGNIKNIDEFNFLPQKILKCFEYINNHDLATYEKGKYEIYGEQLFVNISEYETTNAENRFWEAHKKYLDLHFILDGTEQIDINFIDNMEQKDFVEEKDFLPLEGKSNGCVILNKGDFLICYPKDAHRTAIKVNEPSNVKKAIFKIKIK